MRLLPDAERLALALLRPQFGGVQFGTLLPDDVASRLPFVMIRRVGGAPVDGRFLDRASMSVDVWHTSRSGAADLAEDIRVALLAAWEQQTVTDHGHVAYVTADAAPVELRTPDQPDTHHRFQATYSIATRPPRRAAESPA